MIPYLLVKVSQFKSIQVPGLVWNCIQKYQEYAKDLLEVSNEVFFNNLGAWAQTWASSLGLSVEIGKMGDRGRNPVPTSWPWA